MGEFIKSVGEEYQILKWEWEYYGCGEECNEQKERKAISSSYNIEAFRKNIKWGRGGWKFWGRKSGLRILGWGRISSCKELYSSLEIVFMDIGQAFHLLSV